ncbi:MAG: class I SAM-dependent methyltransferase [Candidatus Cybelea sp.]
MDAYRRAWGENRRRAESHLFWASQPYRDDRSILVAGCGTTQAVHYAVRWPNARVVGIDVSAAGIAFAQELKRKHGLHNLELHRLPVERAAELGQEFDHVICTGVLHHLADPDVGLRALRDVLASGGAMHLMVYAPYGRAGIYMLQEYCRRLNVGWSDGEIGDLLSSLKALPAEHPLVPLLRNSPDFAKPAGVADALLHPRDRSYSVPQLIEFIERAGLVFERWIRQAPYLPDCGAIATTPHAALLAKLPVRDQYAAMELFRGTMTRHAFICYRADRPQPHAFTFEGNEWLKYVPVRLPDTIAARERLPPGAAAVLINRNHTYTDLYMPIDAREDRLLARIDGKRSIEEICRDPGERKAAAEFFARLWVWDQAVFDRSRCD